MSERARGGVQKADILKWANDQQQLDMRSKAILKELASFAGEDCCAWSQVATLAWAANCKDRTVQYCLSKLRDERLIEDTGRVHRLEGTTRHVPIYRLAPMVEGLGLRPAMGAKIAPIELDHGCNVTAPAPDLWVQKSEGMGAIGLHPHRVHGVQEETDVSSPSARDLAEVYREIEEAAPASILRFNDADRAFEALERLAAEGLDVASFPAALRRMAEHPKFKSRQHPPQLHDWLGKRQCVGWLRGEPEADTPSGKAAVAVPAAPRIDEAPEADQAHWRRLRAIAENALTGTVYGSWIAPAYLAARGGQLFMVAATATARDWISRHAQRRIDGWWAEVDPQRRSLALVSKIEFEAAGSRQQGVG